MGAMKALLLALVVLMIAPEALAGGAVWRERKIVVRDHTTEVLRPFVRETVAAFNAMLPKRAPRLRYRVRPVQPCSAVKAKRGVAVCEDAGVKARTGFNAEVTLRRDPKVGHTMASVEVRLASELVGR